MKKVKILIIACVVMGLALVASGASGETKTASTPPPNHSQIGNVYSCLACHNTNSLAYTKKENPNLACRTCHALLLGGVTSKPTVTTVVVDHPSYNKDIQPILQSKCITCHVDIATYAKTVEKVSVGKPAESMLIMRINGSLTPIMPVQGPLSKDQVQTITNWIKDGAKNN